MHKFLATIAATFLLVTPAFSQGLKVMTYDPSSSLLFNSLTGTSLTTSQAALINGTVASLKADGIWQVGDGLYFTCAPTAELALKNWLKPGTRDLTVNGTPVFTAYSGYAGDGAAAYLDTGLPSSLGVFFKQNSADFSVYTPGTVNSNTSYLGGLVSGGGTLISLWHTVAGNTSDRVNDALTLSGVNPATLGTLSLDRSGSAARTLYVNGLSVASDTQASSAPSVQDIVLLRSNVNFAPSTTVVGAAFIGGSLNSTQVGQLNSLMANYCARISSP